MQDPSADWTEYDFIRNWKRIKVQKIKKQAITKSPKEYKEQSHNIIQSKSETTLNSRDNKRNSRRHGEEEDKWPNKENKENRDLILWGNNQAQLKQSHR